MVQAFICAGDINVYVASQEIHFRSGMVKFGRIFIRISGGDVSIEAPEGSSPESVLGGAHTRPLKTPRKKLHPTPPDPLGLVM